MDATRGGRWVRPAVTLGLLGLAAASLLIAPVGAHTTTAGHVWTDHVRPKADGRYDQSSAASGLEPQTTIEANFVDVPGATTTITVPGAAGEWRVLARFEAESVCVGPNLSWCSVQILIGDQPGDPDAGNDFAFDAPSGDPGADRESHSITRSRLLGPGEYTVTVQYRVSAGATSFQIDDWHLLVQTLRLD